MTRYTINGDDKNSGVFIQQVTQYNVGEEYLATLSRFITISLSDVISTREVSAYNSISIYKIVLLSILRLECIIIISLYYPHISFLILYTLLVINFVNLCA